MALCLTAPRLMAQDTMIVRMSLRVSDFRFDTLNGYDFIRSKDNRVAYTSDKGKPMLPVFVPTYIIPYWKTVGYCEVVSKDSLQVPGFWRIYPAQSSADTSWVPPDSAVYYSDSLYPGIPTGAVDLGSFDGAVLARPQVNVFQYRPLSGKLFLYTDMTIKLVFKDSEPPINAKQRYAHVQEIYDDMLREFVENDENIGAWYRRPAIIEPGGKTTPIPVFAIITTQNQIPEASQYADWTDRRGFPTTVVNVATILSSSPGRNPTEKVFNWIQTQYQAGISFVLFLGHESEVPYRYLVYTDFDGPPYPYTDGWYPSDLYFSSVSYTITPECQGKPAWDCDEDMAYGEPGSPSQPPPTGDAGSWDHYPEVFVGRILSTKNASINEAENWLTKTLKYEKDPANAGNLTTVNWVVNREDLALYNQYRDTRTHYPQPPFILNPLLSRTAEYVRNTLNNQACGHVNLYAHGWSSRFVTATLSSEDIYRFWSQYHPSEVDITELTNQDKYFLVYSVGCAMASFDEDSSQLQYPVVDPCVAEGFVEAHPLKGAVTFIGNTRLDIWASSAAIHRAFLDYMFLGSDPNRYLIGVAQAYARTSMEGNTPRNSNLFGSPVTDIWDIATPLTMNTTHPSSIPRGTPVNFTVHVSNPFGGPIPDAMVSIKSNTGQIYEFKKTLPDGTATFTITAGPNEQWIKVTATKHNHKPKESICMVAKKGPMAASESDSLPRFLFLSTKSSNPTRGPVLIEFGIPSEEAGHVSLSVYDASGREAVKIMDADLPAGYYKETWNPTNPSGVYFLILRTETNQITKKLITRR